MRLRYRGLFSLASVASVARVASLAGLLAASTARADAPGDDARAQADAEFTEGKRLLDQGQTAAACARLAHSQELDPKLGRLLNLAFCHEQEGKTASAWGEYNAAAALAAQKGQPDRVDFAREHANSVAKRLSFLHLDVPAGAGSVEIDGGALPRERWTMPVPLNPGAHKVTVSAAGKKPVSVAVTLSTDPGVLDLKIPALQDDSSASTQGPAAEAAGEPESSPHSTGGHRAPAYIAGGVALVGLGVGAVAGMQAMSKKSDADANCPNKQCNPAGRAMISDAQTAATVSTVGFGVGLAGAAAAIWLLIRSSGDEPAAARVTPVLGPKTAGLGLEGTW